jgi:CDP-diacylglycerol--glycerol-3-phosphate 3-phosphatidyltransferase
MQREPLSRRLRVEWIAAVSGAVVAVLVGRAFVDALTTGAAADRWAVVTVAVALYEIGYLRYHLRRNHSGDGQRFASLGIANVTTIVRGHLYAVTAGFLVVSATPILRWAPGVCYAGGTALDYLDGLLARSVGETTVLGAKLDLEFDTLGMLVATLVAISWGRVPAWYLLIGVAGYLFKFVVRFREWRGLAVVDLPESRVRRPLAGLQMAFLALVLPPVLPASLVEPLSVVVMTPSVIVFARDYLVVTGRYRST